MWLLSTLFLGPLGLVAYWVSVRRPHHAEESTERVSAVQRALGSATWAASGNVLGGIGVLALLLYLQDIFGAYLVLQIAATFLVPFCAGWLIFAVSRWISRSKMGYERAYWRPAFVEVVSTCLVLVGVYPTVNILIGRWLSRWTVPFGFDLTYPPLWGALCLSAIAGTLVAYPFHVWMLRRGMIRWDTEAISEEIAVRELALYVKVALVVLSFAAMLLAIFLSMQIAQG